jgi:PAS domain S-box-containing protein
MRYLPLQGRAVPPDVAAEPLDAARPPPALKRLAGCLLFGSGILGMLACAALMAALPLGLGDRRGMVVALCLTLAAAFGVAWVLLRDAGIRAGTLAAGSLAIVGVTLVALALPQRIDTFVLGVYAIVVSLASAAIGRRASLLFVGTCAALVGGLAWGEWGGHLGGAPARAPAQIALHTALSWFVLAAAASIGTLIARMSRSHLDAATLREQRFRSLLRLAADWYWEMDANFRFTHLYEVGGRGSGLPSRSRLGHAPWELPGFGLDAEAMDAHRADLEAHRPFHGLVIPRTDAHGRPHIARASGEPRFDARGVFTGYWGIGQDVTAEILAQTAFAASELRYRELFARAPSPLVLHRDGHVIDANPAALQMFGHARLEDFVGNELGAYYDAGGDSAARLRERIAALQGRPTGSGLPPADFRLVSADGRRLSVQSSGVLVDTRGGPAILSMYHDETERLQADAALRRSEALLSHLVATSPNGITLTEMSSGRFVMVNEAFVRMFGWTRDEAIGRTSIELGTWASPDTRDAFVAAVRERGRVDESLHVGVTKGGDRMLVAMSGARFEMDRREYLVINLRDVTQSERVRLEHAAILQNASIGIAFTRERRFVEANPAFESMFGWPAGGLVDQPGSVVWPSAADHAEVGRRYGPALAAGETVDFEREMLRRDGSRLWCRLRAQALDPHGPRDGGTIWIIEDVTERRRMTQALAAARDAAEAANRAKSAFLANMSHEIRTPLNGLLGLAQLAQEPGIDEARRRQYLQQILDSAQALGGVMSDILDLSKIEAGKLTPETLPFNLRALLGAVQNAYEGLAQQRDLVLTTTIDAAVPDAVEGDPVRLRQILTNYVTNALKFTERGEIAIDVRLTVKGRLRLAVRDTGVGIDDATLARLFRPFTQADESTTRRYGGTGLGLSICRELARLMGGEVGATSRVGAGSTFWAELPLPAARAPGPEPAEATAGPDPLRDARVLMVEDNPVNMLIAVAMLEHWGVVVTQASDGLAALDVVARTRDGGAPPFDAVLMDLQMPVMSGHEAARRLRREHGAETLPIIALTAAALPSERDEALDAGMNDFLTKPIDAQKLRDVLAKWVGARRPAAG